MVDVKELKEKEIRDAVPYGYLMDTQSMGSMTDPYLNEEVTIYRDSHLILLESAPIIIAAFPKDTELEESIIVHPRYANKKDFDFIKVKGYRNGRNIDIFAPYGNHNNILNFKGVGATAKDHMMLDNDNWYLLYEDKWQPIKDVPGSLGRRWGLVDTEDALIEFSNNIFSDNGIAQVPHLKINHMPQGILPFSNVSQIVRGLDTNIRCDSYFMTEWLMGQYALPENFLKIDTKVFEVQKQLFKEKKAIVQPLGRVFQNRFLDGKFIDMENYDIKGYEDEKKLIHDGARFCDDVLTSVIIANHEKRHNYITYLNTLVHRIGLPLKNYFDLPIQAFMDQFIEQKEYEEKYKSQRSKAFYEFRKNYEDFLKN